MRKFLIALFLLAWVPLVSTAEVDREVRKYVKIYFRQGSALIDEEYMGNRATLQQFASEVKSYCEDSTAKFRQIRIVGCASPEGTQKINERVAKARAKAITEWISRKISVKLKYEVVSTHVDWTGLEELVKQTAETPNREEVLEIIAKFPERVTRANGESVNERYNELVKLNNGIPYKWMEKNLFPRLRYADARAEFWWELEPRVDINTKETLKFPAEGAAGKVDFTKNVQDGVLPTATSSASWITALTPKVDHITFEVAPNPYKDPRTATIQVSSYGKTHNVTVEQAGTKPYITITSPSPINFPAEGGANVITFSRNVIDNTVPVVTTESSWLKLSAPTADSVSFTVEPNAVEDPRSANVTVECYGVKYGVVVNQEAAAPAPKPEEKKPFYMAVKTNMLFDVLTIPNLGVEFYLGSKFSIMANYYHSWWDGSKKDIYWRYYGGDVAVRWWFGKASRVKPLQGHHLGIYGQVMTYDFAWNGKGILGANPGEHMFTKDSPQYSVGLEYGYSVPIARRLNLDFTIGVGYHGGIFHEYQNIDGHYVWQVTKRRQYFGPTKAEISLVWLIGRGNYNEKKGGKR